MRILVIMYCVQLHDVHMFDLGSQRPKLDDLNNRVVPWWAPQWRQLGEQLKVGDHLMRIIEHDYPNDCETCCSKMLTEWLDNTPTASWEDLTTAVNNLPSYGTCVYMHK